MTPVSSLIHPVGPEPPGVYWLRRAAFVLAIVTLALGMWWGIDAIRQSDNPPTPAASASAAPSAQASAGQSAEAGAASQEASAEPTPEPTVVAEDSKECPDTAIVVEAKSDAKSYPVDSTPRLTMTITNAGDISCTRDVGTKANELEITSGGFHVWSSDDCAKNSKSKVVTLRPGDTVASSITWDGRLSQKGCPNQGKFAKAGRYDLIARNGEVRSEKQPFALTNP